MGGPGPDPIPERRNFLPTGNDAFECGRCGCSVVPLSRGGFRNHCPECLWSRHVDDVPGDRASSCGGLMRPERLEGSPGSGWYLVHVCAECGFSRRSLTAENDPGQPDRWDRIVDLSAGG
jgi:hypothetical protein